MNSEVPIICLITEKELLDLCNLFTPPLIIKKPKKVIWIYEDITKYIYLYGKKIKI